MQDKHNDSHHIKILKKTIIELDISHWPCAKMNHDLVLSKFWIRILKRAIKKRGREMLLINNQFEWDLSLLIHLQIETKTYSSTNWDQNKILNKRLKLWENKWKRKGKCERK